MQDGHFEESILGGRFTRLEPLRKGEGVETFVGVRTADGGKVVIRGVAARRVTELARGQLERAIETVRLVEDGSLAVANAPMVEGDTLYVVRPFVPGVPLTDRLTTGSLSTPELLVVGRRLMTALRLIHARGVLHLDIKPNNVIVQADTSISSATLVDYSLPREGSAESLRRDQPAGDICYMAPERLGLLDREVDERADLYSCGVILYACIAGRPPFDGSVGEVLHQHLNVEPKSLRSTGCAIPEALEQVIERLLRKDPRDRYQSAEGALIDLDAIADSLARGTVEPPIVVGARDKRRTVTEPALIARRDELETLERAVRRASEGRGILAFITAGSGGGKSRLLDEVRRRASSLGVWVLRGRAVELSVRRPLQVIADAAVEIVEMCQASPRLTDLLRERVGPHRDAICAALPALASVLGVARSAEAPGPETLGELRTIRAVAALFDALGSSQAPAILLLDDCQWVDELSAKVIRHWWRRPDLDEATPHHVTVIAAFRPDELPDDGPLTTVSPAVTVALGPLEPDAVRSLVESMAGPMPGAAIDAVVRLSGGNPFMASAVVHGLAEAGAIVSGPTGWVTDPEQLKEVRSSAQAAQFLLHRLQLLPAETQRLLSVAAVLGKDFDLKDTALLTGLGDAEAETLLTVARRRHLVWTSGEGRYAFIHDRVRSAFLESLADEERRHLHRQVGELLETREPGLVFQIAHHFDAAGDVDRAARPALAAAEQARAQHALEAAETAYRIAERGAMGAEARLRIIIGLADVLTLRGHYEEAPRWYETARSLVSDPIAHARIESKLAEVAFKSSDYGNALRACNAGLRAMGRRAPRRMMAFLPLFLWELAIHIAHASVPRLFVGRRRLGTAQAEADLLAVSLYDRLIYLWYFAWSGKIPAGWACLRALNLAEAYHPTEELGHGYSVLANIIAGGFPPLAFWSLRLRQKALTIQESLQQLHGQGQALVYCWPVSHALMRFDEGIDRARAGRKLLELAGDQWDLNASYWGVALCQLCKGDVRSATEECRRLYAKAKEIGDYQNVGNALWVWAQASSGSVPAELIQDALSKPGIFVTTRVSLLGAEGIRLLGDGRPEAALAPLDEACRLALGNGLVDTLIGDVLAWHACALRMTAEQVPAAAAVRRDALLRQAQKRARQARLFGRIYRLLLPRALRESALVAAARGRPGRARRLFAASVTLADQQGMRLQSARSRHEWAAVGTAMGWPDATTALATAERELYEMGAARFGGPFASDHPSVSVSLVDRFATVLDKGRAVLTSLSRDATIAALRDAAVSILRAERCVFLDVLPAGSALAVQAVHPSDAEYSRSLVERAVEGGKTVVFSADEPLEGDLDVHGRGVRSALCAPVFVRGSVAGCFYVASHQVSGLFGEDEERLAAFIASLAGAAFENVLSVAELEVTHQTMRGELERRVAERTAELQEANRELESFSYSVSHDLRAPLRSIDGFSQALLEDHAEVLPAKGRDYLGRIRDSAQRMGELIDDLLQLSRVSRAEVRRARVDITTLARSVLTELEKTEPSRHVDVDVQEGLVAQADSRLLRIVLENLLGNAWKFTAKAVHPKIEFRASVESGELVYHVRDNGAGFDMAYANKLFGPFQRLHLERDFPGTGIGLATVQRIIRRHGGRVWAEGEVGRGATLSFTLPIEPGVGEPAA